MRPGSIAQMHANPFASPESEAVGATPVALVESGGFKASVVIAEGVEALKRNPVPLIVTVLLATIVGELPKHLIDGGKGQFIGHILATAIEPGVLTVYLAAARRQHVQLGLLTKNFSRFLPLLAMKFLLGAAIVGGLVAFIVPGLILSAGLSLASFFCVDRGLGPVAALKASWQATKGFKVEIVYFGLYAVLAVVLGLLALVIGVVPASAIVGVAHAAIYVHLTKEARDE
jgi:hypothetical protein